MKAPKFVIRSAQPDDFDEVLQLLRQLWPKASLDPSHMKTAFMDGLQSPTRSYFCAVSENMIVGFASLSWSSNLWQTGFAGCLIDELVIAESHRGSGIGSQLISCLVTEARTHGCRVIELASAGHRERAHNFYLRNGFQQRETKLFYREIA